MVRCSCSAISSPVPRQTEVSESFVLCLTWILAWSGLWRLMMIPPGPRAICVPSLVSEPRLVTAPTTLETAGDRWGHSPPWWMPGYPGYYPAQQNNRQTMAQLPCQDIWGWRLKSFSSETREWGGWDDLFCHFGEPVGPDSWLLSEAASHSREWGELWARACVCQTINSPPPLTPPHNTKQGVRGAEWGKSGTMREEREGPSGPENVILQMERRKECRAQCSDSSGTKCT